MSAIDILGFGRAPSEVASESRCAMVGDLWEAVSGDGETGVDWPCRGVIGLGEETKDGGWARTSSGVGANPPRPTLRTRCKIFVPAFESWPN